MSLCSRTPGWLITRVLCDEASHTTLAIAGPFYHILPIPTRTVGACTHGRRAERHPPISVGDSRAVGTAPAMLAYISRCHAASCGKEAKQRGKRLERQRSIMKYRIVNHLRYQIPSKIQKLILLISVAIILHLSPGKHIYLFCLLRSNVKRFL